MLQGKSGWWRMPTLQWLWIGKISGMLDWQLGETRKMGLQTVGKCAQSSLLSVFIKIYFPFCSLVTQSVYLLIANNHIRYQNYLYFTSLWNVPRSTRTVSAEGTDHVSTSNPKWSHAGLDHIRNLSLLWQIQNMLEIKYCRHHTPVLVICSCVREDSIPLYHKLCWIGLWLRYDTDPSDYTCFVLSFIGSRHLVI